MDELVALGVRDVVLAPGSRSAPLAFAAHRADRDGLLRLHVRVDERTAGFLALGLAKASGRPVPVITTSGTAPAHLHPAVLEARHARVPLMVISADRPATMINTGANQTTDQVGLFGHHVLADARLAATAQAPGSWRTALRRLTLTARGHRSGRPGPVHVNVELVDPLTPGRVTLPVRSDFDPGPGQAGAVPVHLPAGPRTVVVAGDAGPATGAAAQAYARSTRAPLLAEPSSNARYGPNAIGTYRLLLGGPSAAEIERVVCFGHPTLSRPVQRLLARSDTELIMVDPSTEWVDPGQQANRLARSVTGMPGDPAWLRRWQDADRRVRMEMDEILDREEALTGWQVAAAVWSAVDPRDALVVASSSPVRDLDLAPVRASAPTVWANRGLSGIDGTLSTAVGVALLSPRRGTTALVGDLAFLHDLNGLVIGPDEPRPALRVVVANDDGGSIFHTLEQGGRSYAQAFERIFGTPHHADLGALVTGLGHRHTRVDDLASLRTALSEPPEGIEVVECRVDRSHRRALDARFTRLAGAAPSSP